MYLKDLAGRYILINQTCVALSGGQADRFIGQTDAAVYPPDLAAIVMENDRQLLAAGESISIEERAISPDDGVERIYLSNKFVLTDDNGQPYALGGVSTDITDRKRAEEALNRTNQRLELANEELQRATRLKDEFLATMSHELRTPLNAILGMSEALEEGVFGELNARQLQSISTIASSGDHLLDLINDILDVSKLVAGKIELHRTQVDLSALCQSSLGSIVPQANAKQICIETQIDRSIGDIDVDERRIRQVLINLLGNAVKFTPAGGRVKLSVELVTAATGHNLRFAVSDTGIGIAAADLDKLFQPFSQIDSRLNRQYQGSGLGLTIVRQLVELHGGEVTVESEVDRGSCFSATIPQAGLKLLSPPQMAVTTTMPAAQLTILLAEDNPVNIATFDSYLTAKGYRTSLAQTGREAIDLAATQHFDAILMDIQMPDLDGLKAIESIRQQPHHARTPIIVLTASAQPHLRAQCLDLGADRFLTKPVKLAELNREIESCLGDAR
jgi:PAS domain S-box-containing protein